ncbi:MAG: tRNA lysidine(34) synthetase TilS [Eubacterium sp.]|nr:tRNA lysidine(34) synthetase TilS [Eubacterium sp.]
MSEIITKIENTVARYNMLTDGDTVVVGVSGGADSMLLLKFLISVQDKYSLKVIVANVEHGIRGEASKADSSFVKAYCAEHNVPFEMLSINAPVEAKAEKLGVEEYSRKRRYEFFNSFGADKIAVAHNLSDNVETVLFRLARGSSVKGLTGIKPVRDNIIRPLIECTSDEIRNACNLLEIPYVVDETNSDTEYTRNYIRNIIIPEFEHINPSFEKAVNRFTVSFGEDINFITKCADECYRDCYTDGGLDISKLKSYDIAVVKRVFQLLADNFNVVLDDVHINGALELLNVNKKYQIKDDIFFTSSANKLRIYKLSNNNTNDVLTFDIITYADYLNDKEGYKRRYDFCLDADKICGNAFIRCRKEGDTISPVGRNCTKTLKKLFNEMKIPAESRNTLQVICDEKGLIAVQNCTADDRVKIDDTTKSVILFNITTED